MSTASNDISVSSFSPELGVRTTWEILWSCIVVVFTCTWISVHPNIPNPSDGWFKTTSRRIETMLFALFAPEYMLMCAIEQWVVAGKVARRFKKYRWTRAHGFFFLMGGFVIWDTSKDRPVCVLTKMDDPKSPHDLSRCLASGQISITKAEIYDRSKRDFISKALVVFQVTWFILQIIARAIQKLPVSELELMALAFAIVNIAIYAVWWYKPVDVGFPVPVYLSPSNNSNASATAASSTSEKEDASLLNQNPQRESLLDADSEAQSCKDEEDVHIWKQWKGLRPVPMFHSSELMEDDIQHSSGTTRAGFAVSIVAILLGGLHCIAWNFDFPTHTEQTLWRYSSITLTIFPVALIPISLLFLITLWEKLIFVSLVLWYGSARIILLIEPFILLRALPPGAFQTVRWTDFIPHL
ncbi:hypothetical protein VKT23_013022 [Stygiomarasmius scandens]|uniref:Uncharacterized protein n=1 Tax=Marasmiellus scandens TaxID=2682957 RepID=A0ABR1J4X5_9AGAR